MRTIIEQLKRAIGNSGKTHYRIGKEANVSPDQLDRFMRGRDIRLSTAAKIAKALGLEFRSKNNG